MCIPGNSVNEYPWNVHTLSNSGINALWSKAPWVEGRTSRSLLKRQPWGLTGTVFRKGFVMGLLISAYFNLMSLGESLRIHRKEFQLRKMLLVSWGPNELPLGDASKMHSSPTAQPFASKGENQEIAEC